jgi:hypothetical protein
VASKVQERIYAETASTLLTANWMLVDIPEPLDFEVRTPTETFGLEVRQIFVDEAQQIFVDVEDFFGSPAKRNEAENLRTVSRLAKRYYESGGPPISAKFLGILSSANSDAVLERMIGSAPAYPGVRTTTEAPQVKVFMTPLPPSFACYSRWTFVNDKVGWLKKVSALELQHAIDSKEENLAHYKEKYGNIELLLVADRVFNSGKLIEGGLPTLSNPGFRNIYFMSYPESIQRVG